MHQLSSGGYWYSHRKWYRCGYESADIVLMRSDLLDVPTAIRLSKATMTNIKENLFWAFGYNVIGIPVAAGVLSYLFGGPLFKSSNSN